MASARDRAASILPGAIIAAAIPFVLFVRQFWWTCDDAFITFRYAKHLARGDGLIFNPGESPPVEGFTNLGWTLWLGLFEAFGASLPHVANISSALAGFALICLVVIWVHRHLEGDLLTTMSTGLVLATLPPLAIWSTSGLETMPFALMVFATFFFLSGEPTRTATGLAAACACAAALLRADGPLWIAFVFLAALVPWFRERNGRRRAGPELRAVITAGLVLTAVVAAQFLWRHSYFGQWVPNTASIKAGFSEVRLERGWKYLASFALAAPLVALVPLSALACLGGPTDRHRVRALQAGLVVLLGTLYPVFVGGDFMAMGRFFVPVLPFVAILFAICMQSLRGQALRAVYAGLMLALSVSGLYDALPVSPELRQRVHFRWNVPSARSEVVQWAFMKGQAERWSILGRALAQHTRAGETLIRGNIGAAGYYSELVILDKNGLVMPDVAAAAVPKLRASPGHDRGVTEEYFYDRRPTYYAATLMVPALVPPGQRLSPKVRSELDSGRLTLERVPLDPVAGFPEGVELWLLRLNWAG